MMPVFKKLIINRSLLCLILLIVFINRSIKSIYLQNDVILLLLLYICIII